LLYVVGTLTVWAMESLQKIVHPSAFVLDQEDYCIE